MTPPATLARPVLVPEELITRRDWRRKAKPAYKVSVVAEVFFAMSSSWMRLHLGKGEDNPRPGKKARPQGVLYDMDFRRLDPDKPLSARLFLLSDIQPMAEVLYAHKKIGAKKLADVLNMVTAQAQLFRLYDDPGEAEGDEDE